MAYAMVTTVKPNVIAIPTNPIPNSGYAAERTALPHPPKTNQRVPINSETNFLHFISIMMVYR